jgi:nucleoside phosphorylase
MLQGAEAMHTLVVAAYPPEIEGLSERLPASLARERILSCAVGVGLVEASAGCARALAETRPARLILVGTAGHFAAAGLATGGVVVAERARLVGREAEHIPAIMPTEIAADAALAARCATILGAPLVTVASPLGVTVSDLEAARLERTGAHAEQLECFAVLAAAARAGVVATAILALSNRVGASGSAEWRQHRQAAEQAALAALARVLEA